MIYRIYVLAYDENTLCVGLARIGTVTQQIAVGTMKEMLSYDLGGPLHSLIIAGKTHYLENDMLKQFAINLSTFETLITT